MIGKRIREYRKHLGLTQMELAEKCGKEEKTIGMFERGVLSPSVSTLSVIATALDVDLDTLVRGTESKNRTWSNKLEIIQEMSHEEIQLALKCLYLASKQKD